MRWAGHVALMREKKDAYSIDRRIIQKLIFKKWDGGIDLIDLTLDRGRWWAFVNVVTNLRVL